MASRSARFSWPVYRAKLTLGFVDAEELLQLAALAVGQSVHRVHDDRAHALAGAVAQDPVDDRNDVGHRLAGSGAGRQDVGLTAGGDLDGIGLVPMK